MGALGGVPRKRHQPFAAGLGPENSTAIVVHGQPVVTTASCIQSYEYVGLPASPMSYMS